MKAMCLSLPKYPLIIIASAVSFSPCSAFSEIIADSVTEFSGNQGSGGWYHGYRNVTADGAGASYDPLNHFIQFVGGDGQGPWNGSSQFWTGTAWDLNTAGAAPWTFIANTNIHPNGVNSAAAPQEHWAIRRWLAEELTDTIPLKITWHMRKQSLTGNGVTGGIYTNGVAGDVVTIPGTSSNGVTHTFYINAEFGTYVDLVLSPVGVDGVPNDSSDGSFNWMTIDTTIPERPEQPDGTIFIPHGSPDTDMDGLPDIWENAYAPGNLMRFNATTDDDGDGSNETQEFQRGTSPIDPDTDDDGLSDGVETDTGTYFSPTDTGTHPRRADTDGDGRTDGAEVHGTPTSNPTLVDTDGDTFSDGSEVSTGHDPNDANHNPNTTWIAASDLEFSGVQGADDWFNGYRNYTADGGGINYDPVTEFIAYPGGEGMGAWGPGQFWDGGGWDMNTGGQGPWTSQYSLDTHPNGVNSAPNQEHWAIRRWVATELTNTTPAVIVWRIIEVNRGGSGVTGSLHVDGKQLDAITIAGGDTNNPVRRFYVNLYPTNVVDLAITPEGPGNNRGDGADGSITWFRVDPTIPQIPRQPDGSVFIPANAADSDSDGLADVWERFYFSNRLDVVTSSTDFDGDGLNESGEFQRDSNPTRTDTDGDGLSDFVETKTGVFVSGNNTGTDPKLTDSDADGLSDSAEINGNPATNPTRADSDEDTFSDSAELAAFSDPNNPADTPRTLVLADSIIEFTGVQGSNDWYNGYRNVTVDGAGFINYDPVAHFIPYVGGPDQGAFNGTSQMWTGSGWSLNTGGSGPWTSQSAQDIHSNGTNTVAAPQEHWAIRRWVAAELTNETPVAIVWRVAKVNTSGTGVTGSLHVNGNRVDFITIAGNNAANPARRFYVMLNPGDTVDLAHTPEGLNSDRRDSSDGSITWFIVDGRVPANPVQPNGTPFTGHLPRVLDVDYDHAMGRVTLTWRSLSGRNYTVQAAPEIAGGWGNVVTGHASAGAQTSYTETLPTPRPARRFYRIWQE